MEPQKRNWWKYNMCDIIVPRESHPNYLRSKKRLENEKLVLTKVVNEFIESNITKQNIYIP